ncbi:MAG: hypothetical protein A2Z96_02640 [Spirochaetes bacterium GWB1_48_6]|nr:MAG: hypothetical protein A2Z96_02640 [Spirochaetes bacterium GWB1_48_6]
MIKKKLNDLDVKTYWQWKDRSRVTRFLLAGGQVRGAYTDMYLPVREMAANHNTGPLETFLLGQVYTAASLLTLGLKGQDKRNIRQECDGPLRGFSVDVNAYGEIRGYLFVNPLPISTLHGPPDFSLIQGKGILTLTKNIENKSVPVSGTVPLVSDYLGTNLEYYFQQSEQTKTALIVDVDMDGAGDLFGATGWMLQAMPGADPQVVEDTFFHFREKAGNLDSQGEKGILSFCEDWKPEILGHIRTEFFCHCTRDRFSKFIQAFSGEEKADILAKGPFPLVTTCHNCSSAYEFTKEELTELFN